MKFARWTSVFTIICVVFAPIITARGIDVNLTSSWPSSVFYPILETSEFLAEENPLYFWRYLDALDKRQDEIKVLTQKKEGQDVNIDAITSFAVNLAQEVAPNTRHVGNLKTGDTLWLLTTVCIDFRTDGVYTCLLCQDRNVPSGIYSNPQSVVITNLLDLQLALDSGTRSCDANTEAWAVIYKEKRCIVSIACSAVDLLAALDQSRTANTCIATGIQDVALSVDHTYLTSLGVMNDTTTVILYGLVGTSSFSSFHRILTPLANDSFHYIVRHYSKESTLPTLLQGYGVSLDIKNLEYKTIDDSKKVIVEENGDEEGDENELNEEKDSLDDEEEIDGLRFTTLIQQHPKLQHELESFRQILLQQDQEQEIKAWHLKDIGISAAREILEAKNPLKRLQILSQDFPKHAKKLAFSRKQVSEERRQEIEMYRTTAMDHRLLNRFLLNGRVIDPMLRSFNIFDMIQTLRKEWSLAKDLAALPLSREERETMLRNVISNKLERTVVRIRVRGSMEGTAPFYLNNIKTDYGTQEWNPNVDALTRPAWNLIFVRTNMYENVVVLDPLSVQGRQAMNQLSFLRMRGAPLQWGLLLSTSELVAAKTPEARAAIVSKYKQVKLPEKATGWHYAKLLLMVKAQESAKPEEKFRGRLVSAYMASVADEQGDITLKTLLNCYLDATGGSFSKSTSLPNAIETLEKDEVLDTAVMSMTEFIAKKHLPFDVFLFNGVLHRHLDIQSDIMKNFGRDQALYQAMARKGDLEDDMDLVNELLTSQGAYPTYFSIFDHGDDEEESVENQPTRGTHLYANDEHHQLETLINDHVTYCHQQGTLTTPKKQTLLVVVDLNDRVHAAHALEAFKAIHSVLGREMRVGLIHRVVDTVEEQSLGELVAAMLHVIGHSDRDEYTKLVEEALGCIVKGKTVRGAVKKLLGLIEKHSSWKNDAILNQLHTLLTRKDSSFLSPVTHLVLIQLKDALYTTHGRKQTAHLFLNGFRIELPQHPISDEDISALMRFDMKYRSLPIAKALIKRRTKFTVEQAHARSLDIVKASAIMDKYRQSDRYTPLEHTNSSIVIQLPGEETLKVHAYIDPVSEAAQRISPLLVMLRTQFNVSIELFPLPSSDHSELPIQRFYRYLFATKSASTTNIQFRKLPLKPILTMKIDTPEAWNVQIHRSIQDLDNLRVDVGDHRIIQTASFRLESLLLYGQCRDITFDRYVPPNGLQLVLERTVGTLRMHRDTLVMKNLGYFQLQATPGIWTLALARGRATEMFEIIDMETDQTVASTDYIVSDFTSRLQQLMVRKRSGKEHEELLDMTKGLYQEMDSTGTNQGVLASYWYSMMSYFSGDKSVVTNRINQGRTGETIHVFSLASGHLYERFLKIMMTSVLKRTQNPVTFWLLENFLSPDFKDSIPVLRETFGMDIRLVTYKWPNWLRPQTQKQRIIWGYKILFLDVLFPLNVSKIIYVDADQVVRADLKELWEMNLHGAPYGYTPFCDSRNIGFQFWRQGYWKDHLRGRPYHISALYVVDLVLFRQMAAGDMLRAVYDQLSADPNSLSNLDQDLPNYAQHQIPIFSLPQEWLWCESWCSDETKAQAKTIDLCNNPKHKEPKLEMAKRVISGPLFEESWIELDREIKQAETQYQKTY